MKKDIAEVQSEEQNLDDIKGNLENTKEESLEKPVDKNEARITIKPKIRKAQ